MGPEIMVHLRNDLYCDEWDVKLYYTILYQKLWNTWVYLLSFEYEKVDM